MSYVVKCSTHNIKLRIPESDNDYVLLSRDIEELLLHLDENPNCTFVKKEK